MVLVRNFRLLDDHYFQEWYIPFPQDNIAERSLGDHINQYLLPNANTSEDWEKVKQR